jgi:hypothetical protein
MRQILLTAAARQVCLTLLLIPCILSAAASTHAPLHVVWEAGRLSIEAEQIPLDYLLQEVARQTGMAVHGWEGLHEPFSVHFIGLPLYQGLQRIPVDFALLWEPSPAGDPRPVRLWIAGPRATAVALAPRPSGDLGIDSLEALQGLVAQANEQTALAGLRQALTGTDLTLKSYAIHALATWDGMDTLQELQQVLHDPDPTVRWLVVEQLGQLVVEQLDQRGHGRPLLEEALADSDEGVRFRAATALELAAWHEQ